MGTPDAGIPNMYVFAISLAVVTLFSIVNAAPTHLTKRGSGKVCHGNQDCLPTNVSNIRLVFHGRFRSLAPLQSRHFSAPAP